MPAALAACGNGVVEPVEECDDGNTIAGDGCDDGCLLEPTVDEADLAIVKRDSPDPRRVPADPARPGAVALRNQGTARLD